MQFFEKPDTSKNLGDKFYVLFRIHYFLILTEKAHKNELFFGAITYNPQLLIDSALIFLLFLGLFKNQLNHQIPYKKFFLKFDTPILSN